MEPLTSTPRHKIVKFKNIEELKAFKGKCDRDEMHIDTDTLTLLGTFTEPQLNLAVNRYNAMISIEGRHKLSTSDLKLQGNNGYNPRKVTNEA